VRFYGYTPSVHPFYHAIDAHLSCSLGSETSSLSLAEGLSAGLPTLASDTPGNRERLGEGGLLFPVGDGAALGRLLLSLCKEEGRRALGERALARARALPTWEHTRAAYGQIFDAFCGELVQKGCFFRKDMI
jgi:glycosyltransferase involved in cell wall biosynthesis